MHALRHLLAIALCLALTAGAAHARAGDEDKAAKIKAAYLLNFIRFAEWPASAFEAVDTPLSLCVVGPDTLAHHLDRTMDGQTVRGRAIAVRRFAAPAAVTVACHLVFLSAPTLDQAPEILTHHADTTTLTVGETAAFVELGTMLALNFENDRIVFYANREAIRNSAVQLSSKILQLARTGAAGGRTAGH